MLHSSEFDTWNKHPHFHGAYADMVAIEQSRAAYDKHLSAFSSTALIFFLAVTAVANAAVSSELPVISSKTVRESEHCVVHPKVVHANKTAR